MKRPISCFALAVTASLLAGCASVSTKIVRLDPSLTLAPSERVEILLEKPLRPYQQIALLESRGTAGGTEAELLEDARERARSLGADAIVRLELEKVLQPPTVVYDPPFAPFYWGYPFRRYPYFSPPYPFFGEYRVVGGVTVYTLKTLAIRYREEADKPQ
jgi:hypothetical protein